MTGNRILSLNYITCLSCTPAAV